MSASSPAPGQGSSPARITEIDISRAARTLGVLRITDYTLVVMCGFGFVGVVPEFFSALVGGQWTEMSVAAASLAAFGFAAYTGYRNVGVIDPRVWRLYLWVFPALTFIGLIAALASAAALSPQEGMGKIDNWLGLVTGVWFSAIAIPGFVCTVMLRRMRLPGGVSLGAMVDDLRSRGDVQSPGVGLKERANATRGIAYSALGALVLLTSTFWQRPDAVSESSYYRLVEQLNLLGFFLIVRARRHFQVRADALLAVDKRPPILFLRSFADDEKQAYGNSTKAVLDFSLETRLANHFHQFGPFIAIGSPEDKVPQPGAARVFLKDDEWQARVLGWMEGARVIVMYCGVTKWVNWELQNIIDKGRSTSLILMVPELKGWRDSTRKRDMLLRIQQLRDAFRGTPWQEELDEFTAIHDLRAMTFVADGSMVMIRSRSRSRDSYHLAALIAHLQLLSPTSAASAASAAPVAAAAPVAQPRRSGLWAAGAAAVSVLVLAVGGLALLGSSNDPKVIEFRKGQLEYVPPVTLAQAQRAGEVLVEGGIFNDDKAASVRLDRPGDRYRLQFVIDAGHVDNLSVGIALGTLGGQVARDALEGAAISIVLADAQWQLLRAIPVSTKVAFGASTLYYSDPVTADEATGSGKALSAVGFGDNKATVVLLTREGGTHHLHFIVNPKRVNDAQVVKAFATLTREVAEQGLGNRAVTMHLCDDEFRTLRSERVGAQ